MHNWVSNPGPPNSNTELFPRSQSMRGPGLKPNNSDGILSFYISEESFQKCHPAQVTHPHSPVYLSKRLWTHPWALQCLGPPPGQTQEERALGPWTSSIPWGSLKMQSLGPTS